MSVDIAFVTVNHSTLAYVQSLTEFFNRLDAPFTFSFTVVDNDSRDGSQEFLLAHPEVHYLQTGQHFGYGHGINRGVAATSSKYICATNIGVILNRESLIALWRFLEERHDVGVCAPRIIYADGRDQGMLFHHSLFSHYATWYAKMLARNAKSKIANATTPLEVDGVTGALFLIRRRSVFPLPALFDEDFFIYHEETALAHALKDRGVACFVIPDVTIIHNGGELNSSGPISMFHKSKYLYLRKFYGPLHAKAIRFLDRLRILPRLLFYSLLSFVVGSERIKTKQHYYKVAWSTAFPR